MAPRVINILAAAGIMLALSAHAEAQKRKVEVHVSGNPRVQSAVGLLVSKGETLQKKVDKMEQINDDNMVITFSYDPADDKGDSYAVAMVTTEDGEIRFSDVKLLDDAKKNESFLALPDCPVKELSRAINQDQSGLIESLVEIRAARREAQQLRVAAMLSGPFLEKLRKLEKGFGFQYARPLSPKLTGMELNDRLSRLVNAIKNYQNSTGGNQQ